MQALIKTKSNFRNLNNQWLVVKEMKGKRVTCSIVADGQPLNVDFTLSEVVEFDSTK
jgi:hypothetical protein